MGAPRFWKNWGKLLNLEKLGFECVGTFTPADRSHFSQEVPPGDRKKTSRTRINIILYVHDLSAQAGPGLVEKIKNLNKDLDKSIFIWYEELYSKKKH
jgi:hypothetical protein